jgi:hypothetical protein
MNTATIVRSVTDMLQELSPIFPRSFSKQRKYRSAHHIVKMWLNAVWRITHPKRLDYPDASHVCDDFVS